LRKLTPQEFTEMWKRSLTGEKSFDSLVDELIGMDRNIIYLCLHSLNGCVSLALFLTKHLGDAVSPPSKEKRNE
jgi:hypothetical protein